MILPNLKLLLSSLFFILLTTFNSCSKDDTSLDKNNKISINLTLTNITRSTIDCHSEVLNETETLITESGFVWSESNIPSLENNDRSLINEQNDLINEQTITQLKSEKTYYIRAYLKYNNKTIYSPEVKIKTLVGEKFFTKMIFVDGGTFTMLVKNNAKRNVTISSFRIGKYELNQQEWISIMKINPSQKNIGSNLPVNNVSWYDIKIFITKLNKKTNKKYRLATEAEWLFAAKGGIKSKNYNYSGSNNINQVAWYKNNSGNNIKDIGTLQANEIGIYDMSGNVSEWVSDWYSELEETNDVTDPQGPQQASNGTRKVIKNGSAFNTTYQSLLTSRFNYNPRTKFKETGFRLALDL